MPTRLQRFSRSGNAGLLQSPQDIQAIEGVLAPDFSGTSLQSVESRLARSGPVLEIQPIRACAQPRECAIFAALRVRLPVFPPQQRILSPGHYWNVGSSDDF